MAFEALFFKRIKTPFENALYKMLTKKIRKENNDCSGCLFLKSLNEIEWLINRMNGSQIEYYRLMIMRSS